LRQLEGWDQRWFTYLHQRRFTIPLDRLWWSCTIGHESTQNNKGTKEHPGCKLTITITQGCTLSTRSAGERTLLRKG
jgi:hypothetical protein